MSLGPLCLARGTQWWAGVRSLAGKTNRHTANCQSMWQGPHKSTNKALSGHNADPLPLSRAESITQGQIHPSEVSHLSSLAPPPHCHLWGVVRPNRMTLINFYMSHPSSPPSMTPLWAGGGYILPDNMCLWFSLPRDPASHPQGLTASESIPLRSQSHTAPGSWGATRDIWGWPSTPLRD